MAIAYSGSFDTPPETIPPGALGWHFERETDPDNANRWRPTGWRVFYADHVLTVDYRTHLCVRDTALFTV